MMQSKNTFKFLAIVILIFSSANLFAQLITVDPAFPTDSESITITFDASQGNAGLAAYTGDVYAHTGVITNNSTAPNDWKYVVSNWGENTAATKLTNIGTDLYTLEIGPSIREYYSVPAGETILQIAIVFRSETAVGGSYLEGKTDSNGDIFIDVYTQGLNVSFLLPDQLHLIANISDQINVHIQASESDSVALYKNNTLITKVAGTEIQTTVNANATGKTWLVAKAWDSTNESFDSTYFFVRPAIVIEDPPTGTEYGINYIDNQTVILCLHAPYKSFAFALGDFSNWELDESVYMKKNTTSDVYWLKLENLVPGQEYVYQYYVDGEIKIADPYAEKVLDPWQDQHISEESYPGLISYPAGKTTRIASVFQTAQADYLWTINNFNAPQKKDLVIYELLVRDFTDKQNYKTLLDSLSYLKYLGVNAIELMPVNEFEGNLSWGYNPSFYFAVDKYYGSKDLLKEFIDSCHVNGIAVIMDMVLNHAFGQNTMAELYWNPTTNQPAGNNPWFNSECPHPPNCWGSDWNHESNHTKTFIERVNKYWLSEFKFDGFRFDFTKGFTNNPGDGWNYDASRISNIKRISDEIWSENQNAYVILEHWCDNSEEKELANYGCMLWCNITHEYQESTMGYPSDFSWGVYSNRGWNNPNLITYMESHDEERMMYKNLQWGSVSGDYSTKDLATALDRMELAAHFFFTIPGPKMIWQFGEFGYDISIDFNGRVGEKPTKWWYYSEDDRNMLFHKYKALIELKKTEPVFGTNDFSYSLSSYMKRINLNHSSMNLTVIGNFNVIAGDIDPQFQHTGWWYDYYSGDSININNVNDVINLEAGEYKLYTDKKLSIPILIGIDKIENSKTLQGMVRPNPSTNEFNIYIIGNKSEIINVEIYNYSGQKIWQKQCSINNSSTGFITWNSCNSNGSSVAPGLYFCKISDKNQTQSIRLVKL